MKRYPETIYLKNGNQITQWYRRELRSYIAMLKDPAGNQIGEAEYSGNRKTHTFCLGWMVENNGGQSQTPVDPASPPSA